MQKFKEIRKASIFGVLGNFFLAILKGVVAFFTGSEAMLADAFNSASDVFSSVMTFIGNKIASKPRDEDHNLGHGKAEYIYALLISIAMLFFAFQVMKDSVLAFTNASRFTFSIWLVVVCLITILVKIMLYVYTHKLCIKYHNLLMEANSKDHRNDIFVTSLTLLSCFLGAFQIYVVDSIVGLFIAIWIFLTGLKIFKDSYDVLMDKSIKEEAKQKVLEIVSSHEEIKNVIHFNSTPIGYQYQISFTIYVDGNLSTFASHEIANHLEKEIIKKVPEVYLAVIHVNPVEIEQ